MRGQRKVGGRSGTLISAQCSGLQAEVKPLSREDKAKSSRSASLLRSQPQGSTPQGDVRWPSSPRGAREEKGQRRDCDAAGHSDPGGRSQPHSAFHSNLCIGSLAYHDRYLSSKDNEISPKLPHGLISRKERKLNERNSDFLSANTSKAVPAPNSTFSATAPKIGIHSTAEQRGNLAT